MKVFSYVTVLVLAVVPLMLSKKKDEDMTQRGREVDTEEIFEFDLKGS